MIHVSLKVNCTGCSAETACSLPCTWTCSSDLECDRTRANLRHFPLAFCTPAAVHRAGCWQRQRQEVLGVNTQGLPLHGGTNSGLGHQWKCLVWSCKQFCKTAEQLVTTAGPAKELPRASVMNGCCKPRLKDCIRQQPYIANLSNFHIQPGSDSLCFPRYIHMLYFWKLFYTQHWTKKCHNRMWHWILTVHIFSSKRRQNSKQYFPWSHVQNPQQVREVTQK